MPRVAQIIPYYSHPHVGTYINDYSFYNEETSVDGNPAEKPFNTVVVTGADTGIDNKFIKLSDFSVKEELFGKGNYQKYGQPSIQADVLLRNSQTNVWFMRVLPRNARYANIVVIMHYRIPEAIRDNWTADQIATTDTTNDCEIKTVGGTPTNPNLIATGLKQLEVKFSTINVTNSLPKGVHPTSDGAIEEFIFDLPKGIEYTNDQAAQYGRTPAELQGYYSVPILYVRSIGRGRYGNKYSIRIQRDNEFEYDHDIKSYGVGLVERTFVTKVRNYFVGTLVPTSRYDTSTMLDDVIGAYDVGTCPIHVKTYPNHIREVFEAYRSIVAYNNEIFKDPTKPWSNDPDRLADFNFALNMVQELIVNGSQENIDKFDPVFGLRLNSELPIPYYQNFTASNIPYASPNVTLTNYFNTVLEPTDADWDTFITTDGTGFKQQIGDRVLVKQFLGMNGIPSTVTSPNALDRLFIIRGFEVMRDTTLPAPLPGVVDNRPIIKLKILHNEGVWVRENEHEFNGTNLSIDVGRNFNGGYDGEFEEIIAEQKDGLGFISGSATKRPPNEAEMKLLLAREQVLAFRGEKDKYILSPARIDLDFIFDAGYNICQDLDTNLHGLDSKTRALFANSSVLTDVEYRQLYILQSGYDFSENLADARGIGSVADLLNVKKALYQLNNYRNKNGMVISREEGAGCSLHLDCGTIAITRTSEVSNELRDLLQVMSQFEGRNCSIDFGAYEIYDPYTRRRIPVTTGYFLSERLIPHCVSAGRNTPFVNDFAQITNMVRNSFKPELDLIDWDVKELLYTNRINYYITSSEGRVVQRCTQNTCQRDPSALLEENNVRVLHVLKKGIEVACRSYLYSWNDPIVRKGFTDAQMDIYRPWLGVWVDDLNIYFDANKYEEDRMILHCYVDVKFRDIIKRITIEIDISKPSRVGGMI